MTISRQEEIISALWAIAALLAFGFDYVSFGWMFAVKSALDLAWSVYFGCKEVIYLRSIDKVLAERGEK